MDDCLYALQATIPHLTLVIAPLISRLSKVTGDKERTKAERLKVELTTAFAAPESAYEALDAETVIARNAMH